MHPAPVLPATEPILSRRRRPLVAVLPFTTQHHNDKLRLLGADVADALRRRLAVTPGVGSLLIRSEFLSRAPDHARELICRQLRVGHLVSGRCYEILPGITSLYIELADTRSWHVTWADFIKGNARDLLDIRCDAMTRVVESLRTALQQRSHSD